MVDISAKGSSSPWDEPLDEKINEKPKKPTVVGDLDFNKQADPAKDQSAEALKVPSKVEEKVGAKIDAKEVVPQTEEIKVNNQQTITPQAEESNKTNQPSDFWQSAYSRSSGNPSVGTPAPAQVTPQPMETTSSPAAQPVSNQPNNQPVAAQNRPAARQPQTVGQSNNFYQPIPSGSVNNAIGKTVAAETKSPLPKTQKIPTPKIQKIKMIITAAVVGVFMLFVGGIYLTEAGLISVGLEKFYGLLHLEAIWGGLPNNSQNALAISASEMTKKDSYKVTANATMIINRGVKSDLISPIVAAGTFPVFALRDRQIGEGIKAIFAAVEEEFIEDELAEDFDQSEESDFSDSEMEDSLPTTPTPSQSSSQESLDSTSVTKKKPTVEEFEVNLTSGFDDKVSGAKINLSSTSKPSSTLDLVYSSGKLYVKTSKDIVFDPLISGSWLAYDLKKFKDPSPSTKFWSSNFTSSDFSLVGKRVGNETISGVRCFHYSAIATVGEALSDFGLSSDSLSSLDVEYWIGAKDHLVYQMKIKAIPTSKSAISRLDIVLNFSDYGSGDSGFILPATSTTANLGANTTDGQPTTADLTTSESRDTKRKSDLANIAKALDSYQTNTGQYPISANEKISSSVGTLYKSLVPNYITLLPLDPLDPTYYYGYDSDGRSYTLSAVLEDANDSDGRKIGNKNIYFLKSQ